MSIQINMHEAKTRLSELVAATERGEEVILARNGKAVVRLVAVDPAMPEMPKQRLGAFKSNFILPKDWDAPLNEDELADWAGPVDPSTLRSAE
jgi:prevent-host-death family protein